MKMGFIMSKQMMNNSLVSLLILSACATKSESPAPIPSFSTGEGGTSSAEITSCEEGKKRTCHITLDTQNGVTNCFVGVQYCVAGVWSDCGADQ